MSQIIDVVALPVSDRLRLIEELWDSIDAEASDPLPVPGWHQDEIDRRLNALGTGASIGAPWAVVRERIAGAR